MANDEELAFAQAQVAAAEEEQETAQARFAEEQSAQELGSASVGPFDPDFYLALFLAFILDILSWLFMGADLGIIAAAVNAVLGFLLVVWMVWRGKRLEQAKQQYETAVRTARKGRAGFGQRKRATQRMVARGVGKKASRRFLRRSLVMYIGNCIPIVNFIPFWIVGVLLMLREK